MLEQKLHANSLVVDARTRDDDDETNIMFDAGSNVRHEVNHSSSVEGTM
jgi:hypothetical protein